jgi:2-polyprenyl-6-methoxyphenol hydroxylase-like FAD-dependent oxidoreductase
VKEILIVGGGTAGWMTACLMADKWLPDQARISLVESENIGIIGVGEGSTPYLKTFFDHLGIEEREWMPACNATYKAGITFDGWSSRKGFESYFHPFQTDLDGRSMPLFESNALLRRQGVPVETRPDELFLNAVLAQKKLAPKPAENFPFSITYGYHFESAKLGEFLRDRAIAMGVNHITADVIEVRQHENGDIASVETRCGKSLAADCFVDCSGFRGLLIQQTLGARFIPFKENLFNDTAVAMPTPVDDELPCQTISTALKHGWAWKIPLRNRYGNGYVYSSEFCSHDDAETELREHLGLLDADVEARRVPMKVGRLAENWKNNCVAVGLSQGFIEPLEATGLQFIQSTIIEFISAYEKGDFGATNRDPFNQKIATNFERIRDYIVLHYYTNSRKDTEYWKANQRNPKISEKLKAMVDCWTQLGHVAEELKKQGIEQYYQSISWHSLLAGMGIFPDATVTNDRIVTEQAARLATLRDFLAKCSLNFTPHRAYLEQAQG